MTKSSFFVRMISFLCIAAMLAAAVPSVAADAAPVPLSEPNACRLLCALNGFWSDDDGTGWLKNAPYLMPLYYSSGDPIPYSMLVNEETGVLHESVANILESLTSVYTLLDIYANSVFTLAYMDGDMDQYADFYKNVIIDEVFGGETNEKGQPNAKAVFDFLLGDMFVSDEDGNAYVISSDYVQMENADVGNIVVTADDLISPNGIYIFDGFYAASYGNVYDHLKEMRSAGELSAVDAFEILTGYGPDAEGFLHTISQVICYITDSDGNRVKNAADLIEDDLTVGNTGLTAREYAISYMRGEADAMMDVYDLFVPYGSIPESVRSKLYIEDAVLEEYLDAVIAELSAKTSGERELAEAIVNEIVSHDENGYIVSDPIYGYAEGSDGEKIRLSDIMTDDGKFLTDAYGAETVWELIDAYIEGLDYVPVIMGDANGDGIANSDDVIAVLRFIAGWNISIDETAADVNGSGIVDTNDAILMLRYFSGWDVHFVY